MRGLRADRICSAASTAFAGSSTVITGTLLGARSDDQTSSEKSLALAGTVMTGTVDIADNTGPAPLERPILAITTVSGISWIIRFKVAAPATGSLWIEQVTTVIRSLRSPSASKNASVLSLSEPRQR